MSAAELSFYKVLQQVVGDKAIICPKVSLRDLFFVSTHDRSKKTTYINRIARKHVDFVLCNPENISPICGIELDDSFHSRYDRVERDLFVEEVFKSAGLELVRFENKYNYTIQEVADKLNPILNPTIESSTDNIDGPPIYEMTKAETATDTEVPICKKCGVPMVLRTATKGAKRGQSFYGCPNFPKCKEIIELK